MAGRQSHFIVSAPARPETSRQTPPGPQPRGQCSAPMHRGGPPSGTRPWSRRRAIRRGALQRGSICSPPLYPTKPAWLKPASKLLRRQGHGAVLPRFADITQNGVPVPTCPDAGYLDVSPSGCATRGGSAVRVWAFTESRCELPLGVCHARACLSPRSHATGHRALRSSAVGIDPRQLRSK